MSGGSGHKLRERKSPEQPEQPTGDAAEEGPSQVVGGIGRGRQKTCMQRRNWCCGTETCPAHDCGIEGYDQTDGYEGGVAGNVLTSALSSGTGLFCVLRDNFTSI